MIFSSIDKKANIIIKNDIHLPQIQTSLKNINIYKESKKIVVDLQKEYDEDIEFLNMLDTLGIIYILYK